MKRNKLPYHLAFWFTAYLVWVFIVRNGTLVFTHAVTIQFCYLIFIAGNYYFNSFFTVPYLLNRKKYGVFAVCFIGGILITALLRVPISFLVNKYVFDVSVNLFRPIGVFLDSFVNILFWVVLILGGKLLSEKINAQRYIEQIEKEKSENELNFLRAQFNPHFLFNSINSIYAHIDKSNREARQMLLVFSDMLRYQLYECSADQIDLQKEIAYLRNYISLQQSRMDERIQVMFCAEGLNGQIKVAPLLFITFMENAFKYVGFNESRENIVNIQIGYHDGDLFFKVYNSKDSYINHSIKSSGLGIANVKRRLELLYPTRHELKIEDHEYDYSVELILKKV